MVSKLILIGWFTKYSRKRAFLNQYVLDTYARVGLREVASRILKINNKFGMKLGSFKAFDIRLNLPDQAVRVFVYCKRTWVSIRPN